MNNTFSPFLALIFVIFLVIALVAYLRDQRAKNELRQRGVTITARVTGRNHEVQTHTDNENHTTSTTDIYYVTYQYIVNEQTYSRRESVDTSVYDALTDGQPVEVVYLPENPGEARLASDL